MTPFDVDSPGAVDHWDVFRSGAARAAERHAGGRLAGATIVVLGASGAIGRAVLQILAEMRRQGEAGPARIVGVARGAAHPVHGTELVPGSTTDPALYARLPRPDYVVYLAGTTSDALARARETIETNVVGMLRATDYAAGCRGLVFASSMRVYGPFVDDVAISEETRLTTDVMASANIYEASKRLVEGWIARQVELGELAGTVVRLANIYGPFASRPRAGFVGSIVDEIVRTGAVRLRGHPESTRNYCFSIDAADGTLLALSRGRRGAAYNLGSREHLSNIALVRAVADLIDPATSVEIPDAVWRQPRSATTVSIERAAGELGFAPRTTLAAALPLTVAWTRSELARGG